MTDVTTEVADSDNGTDEVQFIKSRKLSCKQNDPVVEKCAVKRFKKQKRRPKRTKVVKPAAPVTSDFISSSRRLTRRIGLFSNGKTSTKVSRFKTVASAETKARVEQDLHQILNLACDNHRAVVTSDKSQAHANVDVSSKKCSCHHKCCDKIKENPVLSSPVDCNMASPSHQKTRRVSNSFHKNVETLSSSEAKNSDATKKFSSSLQPEVDLGSVIKRLHATLHKKSEELFPGVSLRTTLKSELFALQSQLKMSKGECSSEVLACSGPSKTNATPTSEANHTSTASQAEFCLKPQTFPQGDNQISPIFKLDFHSESLPYSAPVNEWLLSVPAQEERAFVNSDKELFEEKQLHSDVCDSYGHDGYDLLSSTSFQRTPKKYAILRSASPDSDGQPTWKLQSSPFRPLVDSPAASWNYLRCKMY